MTVSLNFIYYYYVIIIYILKLNLRYNRSELPFKSIDIGFTNFTEAEFKKLLESFIANSLNDAFCSQIEHKITCLDEKKNISSFLSYPLFWIKIDSLSAIQTLSQNFKF